MDKDNARVSNLIHYVYSVLKGENGRELYFKFREDIEKVTPGEVFSIFYSQLEAGFTPKEILVILDKVINVFYKSLAGYSWDLPGKNTFLGYLMQENTALKERLDEIKKIIKDNAYQIHRTELCAKISELQKFNSHYLKKENILFPYMEKKEKKFDGLAIMWALHDETRKCLKEVIECLNDEKCCETDFNRLIGALFFAMYGLIQKEELILFPAASEIINEKEWAEMLEQSLEYEFPFIEKPEQVSVKQGKAGEQDFVADEYLFRTETGMLSLDQILMIFNALPVDMTFVDENDQVRYFTRPNERIFPRSPAVIGRNVDKCHPPKSVHVVHKIIDSFRAGVKNKAEFWIELKGRMILIQYFALRDSSGKYRGVLEVSQDITGIRKLEGERRLLQWEE